MEQKNVNKNASKKNVAKSSKNSKKVIAKKAVTDSDYALLEQQFGKDFEKSGKFLFLRVDRRTSFKYCNENDIL